MSFNHEDVLQAIEKEREACAMIADVKVNKPCDSNGKPWDASPVEAAKEIAARIRDRGRIG
jgi:hypothetical protein